MHPYDDQLSKPVRDLLMLITPADIAAIEEAIQTVQADKGFGRVTIIIEGGTPKYVGAEVTTPLRRPRVG